MAFQDLDQPQAPVEKLLKPFQEFVRIESSASILLMLCVVAALAWANSPWGDSYETLWEIPVVVGVGGFVIDKPLLLWINDGLMAIFFFLVGLEIKREILAGELASLRKSALPLAAALGGMLVPAALYTMLNAGTEGQAGWAIPMATDIAFALGILGLLGKRVPVALKVFLTALAIVDDIGAVLVIAFFYTEKIVWGSLGLGVVFLVVLVALNRLGVRHTFAYTLLGVGLWVCFLKSGVHATLAGVLLALTIPATRRIGVEQFVNRARAMLDKFRAPEVVPGPVMLSEEQQSAVQAIEGACQRVETPLYRLEHNLHPWVGYGIMPLFALANAGVVLEGSLLAPLASAVSQGIVLGLVVGKQVGITLFAWLAVRLGWAALPESLTWRQIYGAGWLAGVGFTMSLFIANLAFGTAPLLSISKVGILSASLVSGVIGWWIVRQASPVR